MEIHISSGGDLDWATWIQAFASLIAVAVTAAQWWFAHRQLTRERLDRIRSAQVAMSGVYVALKRNIAFMAQEMEKHGPEAGPNFATAMLGGGTVLMKKVMASVDLGAVSTANVDAVMSAQTVFEGILQALQDMADDKADAPTALAYLQFSIRRFEEALLLMKPQIPAEVLR